MQMRLRILAVGLALAGLGLGAGVRAQGGSPFMPPSTPAPAAPVAENSAVVFAGVIGTGADARFCLVIPDRRQVAWVHAGEEGHPFVVQGYNAEQETVTVNYGGRVMTLKLQAAKIAAAPANGNGGASGAPAGANPLTATVVPNPTPADEQRRLEAVAAEVRRRRALRAAAQQQGGQQAQPSGQPAQPQNGTPVQTTPR